MTTPLIQLRGIEKSVPLAGGRHYLLRRITLDIAKGEFVTITRHGKPVAALVSVEAADIARKAMEKKRPGLVAYLRTFPGDAFERNPAPSRPVDL